MFERTVEWAIEQGIETATFHILTPYPGTALYSRMAAQRPDHVTTGISTTRVTRFSGRRGCRPRSWSRVLAGVSRFLSLGIDRPRRRGARQVTAGPRHFAYAAGWKKFEPLWDLVIRAKRAGMMLPVLETILSEFGKRAPSTTARTERADAPPDLPDDVHPAFSPAAWDSSGFGAG